STVDPTTRISTDRNATTADKRLMGSKVRTDSDRRIKPDLWAGGDCTIVVEHDPPNGLHSQGDDPVIRYPTASMVKSSGALTAQPTGPVGMGNSSRVAETCG